MKRDRVGATKSKQYTNKFKIVAYNITTHPQHPYKLENIRMLCNTNMMKMKTAKQMERHLKGMSNHYRIEILLLIAGSEGITLEDIVEALGANEKTLGEHTRRLYQAGLINKKYRGKFVEHTLSPYGKTFVSFLKSFQRI
ncbi:MAG: hypothetical protein UV01_C0002G0034 [Parcubacteria group bacterium GW2011_GWA2_42_14]|nr:MAG: hypothetical protein UV01_C0002G0034 [Parcubacteria group bacterium GW2011_GWA2_42_14]